MPDSRPDTHNTLPCPTGGRRCCGLRRRPARPRAAPRRTAASQAQGGDDKYWSQIKGAREQQLAATDLLAKLLQAPDPKAVAQQHLGSLTEQFFQIASTYMTMVGWGSRGVATNTAFNP